MNDTCRTCGMPLAYDALVAGKTGTDNFLSPREQERLLRVRRLAKKVICPRSSCSYCAAPDQHAGQAVRLGATEFVLDMALDLCRSGGGPKGLLARGLASVLPGRAARFTSFVQSIPKKTETSQHDALVLTSGGKDSSYMLLTLARKGLDLCAWMLDQNYQSPTAVENASALCEQLGVPLVVERPEKSAMDALFRLGTAVGPDDDRESVVSAMTYGSVCWPCFSVLFARASAFCAAHDIPLCFIGTQRGQNRIALLRDPGLADRGLPRLEDRAEQFAAPLRALAAAKGASTSGLLDVTPCRAVTVPFYEFIERPPTAELMRTLGELGWRMPDGTGSCSSNCLLNELGRKVMRERFGFDLYQISDALERRLSGEPAPPAGEDPRRRLDEDAVRRAAKRMRLDRDEVGGAGA